MIAMSAEVMIEATVVEIEVVTVVETKEVTVVVVAWEAVTRSGLVTPTLMPTFTDTVAELGTLLETPTFRESLLLTLRAWAVGLLIAASIGIPLGVVLGLSDRAYRFVRIPLEAIRPVPPIVILPLALLALGGNIAFQATLIVQGGRIIDDAPTLPSFTFEI